MTREKPLPDLLSGERREIRDPRAGRISYYVDGPAPERAAGKASQEPPLLLIHSVNAAASAHEIKPLFDACKSTRRTYAIDLPGYGHSDRSKRPYRQPLMVAAIHAVVSEMQAENGARAVDTLAVSLSCEFLAKAALEAEDSIRSVGLISPTGFSRNTTTRGPPETDRGSPAVYRLLSAPILGRLLFRLLTSPPSVRFFLRKTWGSKQIDEEMFRNCCRMTRAPGAHWAPFHFLSGYLSSADIRTIYEDLAQPVWMAHGTRGDFTDFSRAQAFAHKPNWRVTRFQTGALAYFEVPEAFLDCYEDFLDRVSDGRAVDSNPSHQEV